MTKLSFSTDIAAAVPLTALTPAMYETWSASAPPELRAWADANGFSAKAGQCVAFPGPEGKPISALAGLGDLAQQARVRFALAGARLSLPAGIYSLANPADVPRLEAETLGWLLAGYRFETYVNPRPPTTHLLAPDGIDADRVEAIASGEQLTRDLINTPANDLGPAELEAAVNTLAKEFDASVTSIVGDDLLTANLPLIHTVGAASTRAPRLIDLKWGDTGPRVTLVGKGVCFDTGGLNLKPGESMGLMKKDMGGAATVLGLAYMIMALGLPLRLRVLIPAVENAVGGNAFRPGDILRSRKGLTVEINNTDAEGRLVLADALALACEDTPDLLVSMATLTGAARVAVGPDLAPFYCGNDRLSSLLSSAAVNVADPVWRLPFWDPYEAMIEPAVADLDNAPKGGFAGSITAALFLRRFVDDPKSYMHFDVYGWQPTAAPARPKGGIGQGARALFEALPEMMHL